MRPTLWLAWGLLALLPASPAVLALDLVVSPAAPAVALEEQALPRSQLPALRRGGLVVYLRHGLTDNSRTDRASGPDLADCGTQRPLSADGRRMAERVGAAMRRARWPVSEVLTSPMCRARDSAEAAFGTTYTVDPLLAYTANLSTAQKQPILAATRRWLSTPVQDGQLRVVVAHGPNLADLTGYFPTEGTAVVFRPLGDGRFEYLGSVRPDQWDTLLR